MMSNPFEKDLRRIVAMKGYRPFMNLCGWYEDGELVFRYCENRSMANSAARKGNHAFFFHGDVLEIISPRRSAKGQSVG